MSDTSGLHAVVSQLYSQLGGRLEQSVDGAMLWILTLKASGSTSWYAVQLGAPCFPRLRYHGADSNTRKPCVSKVARPLIYDSPGQPAKDVSNSVKWSKTSRALSIERNRSHRTPPLRSVKRPHLICQIIKIKQLTQ